MIFSEFISTITTFELNTNVSLQAEYRIVILSKNLVETNFTV